MSKLTLKNNKARPHNTLFYTSITFQSYKNLPTFIFPDSNYPQTGEFCRGVNSARLCGRRGRGARLAPPAASGARACVRAAPPTTDERPPERTEMTYIVGKIVRLVEVRTHASQRLRLVVKSRSKLTCVTTVTTTSYI